MSKAFEKLAKKVSSADDQFEDGDVIRWKARPEMSDRDYTYAAVRAAGKWWITGTSSFYRRDGVSYDQLVTYLKRKDVHSLQAATDWTDAVKLLPEPVRTRMAVCNQSKRHEPACRWSGLTFSEVPASDDLCCCAEHFGNDG